jgi:hypothetical protein
VAGTYNLTAMTVYPSDGGISIDQTLRETVVVSDVTSGSLTIELVHQSGAQIGSVAYSEVISGDTLVETQTCPAVGDAGTGSSPIGFTATSTTFTAFLPGLFGGTQVSVFEKTSP